MELKKNREEEWKWREDLKGGGRIEREKREGKRNLEGKRNFALLSTCPSLFPALTERNNYKRND